MALLQPLAQKIALAISNNSSNKLFKKKKTLGMGINTQMSNLAAKPPAGFLRSSTSIKTPKLSLKAPKMSSFGHLIANQFGKHKI